MWRANCLPQLTACGQFEAAKLLRRIDPKGQSGQTTFRRVSIKRWNNVGANMDHLSGKVAIVTGAGRGIGQRTAIRLAQLGMKTLLVSRTESQLQETAALVTKMGGKPLICTVDLSKPEAAEILKNRVVNEMGHPSVLINAAGIFGPINVVWKTDPNEWINTQMVNFVSAYLLCHAFIESMLAFGWGRIINVSSAATLHEPGPINSAYGTSKAALNQFTRHLASEIAGSGVTANVIHPGDVKTDMWATIKDATAELGPLADRYRDWAKWVAETGGDDPEKASDLIVALMGMEADRINGRFLWIKDGLQSPIPSWGPFLPNEVWQ
jgi:NAD(P)-dependent dehydrogenase (short-subunit alcohol dehydrogenase family)